MDARRGGRGGLATASRAASVACARFAALVTLSVEVIGQWLVVVSIPRIVWDVIRILGLHARESICERGTGRR